MIGRYEDLFFSPRLLTLTLVKLDHYDPLTNHEYRLAPNLRELSINHFGIQELKPFPDASLEKLKRLNLANNKISSLPENFFRSLPKLEVLILEGNQFETIHLPPTLHLKELYLDDNPIDGNEGRCEFLQSASIVHYKTINQICPDHD
ncbi:epiphycan-like [Brevipalpus obovatus]|uniref:epiphycan-like n=1 Tax=Brevipalpus obovatus TaxID=246614 RepID=UPI003D9DEC88